MVPAPSGTPDKEEALSMGSLTILDQGTQRIDAIPIFNLSQHILSSAEISLLSKGLSYVITERMNFFNLKTELFQFFRKIRLKLFFKDREPMQQDSVTGLRLPSTFYPTNSMMPPELITFEKQVLRGLDNLRTDKNVKHYRH